MTGVIVVETCLARCIFTPESAMASMCLLVELGGVPILLIKPSLGVLVLILVIIAPNRHLHTFSMPPSISTSTPYLCGLFYLKSML